MNLESSRLEIKETVSRDRRTLVLVGEADLQTAPSLKRVLADACESAKQTIVVDLRNLTFIDSSGLHALVEAFETCTYRGLEMKVIPGPPNVQRLFQLTGIEEVLSLFQLSS